MPRRTDFGRGVRTVKTSVEIPEDIWRAAKIRALDDRKNFQEIVAEALREFLKRAKKGGGIDER